MNWPHLYARDVWMLKEDFFSLPWGGMAPGLSKNGWMAWLQDLSFLSQTPPLFVKSLVGLEPCLPFKNNINYLYQKHIERLCIIYVCVCFVRGFKNGGNGTFFAKRRFYLPHILFLSSIRWVGFWRGFFLLLCLLSPLVGSLMMMWRREGRKKYLEGGKEREIKRAQKWRKRAVVHERHNRARENTCLSHNGWDMCVHIKMIIIFVGNIGSDEISYYCYIPCILSRFFLPYQDMITWTSILHHYLIHTIFFYSINLSSIDLHLWWQTIW